MFIYLICATIFEPVNCVPDSLYLYLQEVFHEC